jgi:predicted secreted protein
LFLSSVFWAQTNTGSRAKQHATANALQNGVFVVLAIFIAGSFIAANSFEISLSTNVLVLTIPQEPEKYFCP